MAQLLEETERDAAEAIVVPFGSGIEVDAPRGKVEHEAEHGIATAGVARRPSVATSNGDGAHADHNGQDQALTVTVPLRITVRQGNGSGREAAIGVNLS